MEPVYRPVIGLALSIFKAMAWDIRTYGVENIPASGPAVLASNHVGYLDFVFVGAAARQRGRLVRFMAKKEVFDHKVSGPLMRGMKHIPVDRFGDRKRAIDLGVDALRRGELVGMFPEGTISRSFVPRAGKDGATRMALEAEAPLIPCAVWGSQRILTKDRPKNFERKVAIDVHIGAPLKWETGENATTITGRLMDAIGELVERAQTEYRQAPASPEDSWWLPAHLGGSAPTVEAADERAARDREERARSRKADPS
ncbi:MAG TPA: lysophospholipid acyltransferase family protein [Actinomycetota bacterium]|jgi:1-acyl-sn-glycerol-3-phosphate acyltransferase